MRWVYPLFVLTLVASCVDSGESAQTASTEPISSTSTTQATTTTSLSAEFPAIRSEISSGWEAIELPLTAAFCHQVVIPTEQEIVIWGGNQTSCEYESPVGDPGLAYNPTTGTWRQLPTSPLEPAVAPTGVWTGTEILICCGMEGGAGSTQAAAYDPKAGTWRSLPDAPLGGPFPVSVWTGSEMLVATQSGVATYNPSTDSWGEMPDPPQPLGRTNEIAWTGNEVIVWPANVTRSVYQGMALAPDTGAWRILPDPPAWPAALDLVYTNDALFIWGGLPAQSGSERAVGSRLDLATNEWAELPEPLPEPDGCECNLGSQTVTWTGEYVMVSPGFFSSGLNPISPLLIAYDPDADTWIRVSGDSPAGLGDDAMLVGDRIVVTEHVITGSNRLLVSPAGWQPTGEPMPTFSSSDD
jgi:hypothetical protein